MNSTVFHSKTFKLKTITINKAVSGLCIIANLANGIAIHCYHGSGTGLRLSLVTDSMLKLSSAMVCSRAEGVPYTDLEDLEPDP